MSNYIPLFSVVVITYPGPKLNTLRPRLNRRHFADEIFKCIFDTENEWISPRISLKFVSKVRINNIPALVQIMAWRRPGDKSLSEPMMASILTHKCVTRPQSVNAGLVYLCHQKKALVHNRYAHTQCLYLKYNLTHPQPQWESMMPIAWFTMVYQHNKAETNWSKFCRRHI